MLSVALGKPASIVRRSPLGGGCISHVERLDTSAGTFVLKWMDGAPAGLFEAEAAGLEALRSANSDLIIPRVVAVESEPGTPLIILEYLAAATATARTDERLGRGLAQLHRTGAHAFGFATSTYCGATLQPNAWTDRWVPFFAEQRLAHQVRLARDAGLLSPDDCKALDRVVTRLDRWIGEPAGPSLVHGDLWSGNRHVTTGGAPALLDPAACYAHREMEFGIMRLFGGFSATVYDAYDEAFPLERGWRERVPLYQLYHLLNHLNLFGSSYHRQAMDVAERFA